MSRSVKTKKTNVELALEEVDELGHGTGLEAELVDTEGIKISEPFDPEKIDVYTKPHTVDLIMSRIENEEIDLSPDFQRRSNLWNDIRKSLLIESMLLRIPLPSLYLSEDKRGNYVVVDGLQRLCAIAHFVNVKYLNKLVGSTLPPLKLCGLQSLKELEGKSFPDLPRQLQRRINETELMFHIIRPSTPPKVMFNIFSRINQGGLPLKAQEIRNAVYQGPWREYVRKMAQSDSFIKATQKQISSERMEDESLVLRFLSLYVVKNNERPIDQNLDEFLNGMLESKILQWSQEQWVQYEDAFARALMAAEQIFGKYAFRKYSDRFTPINRGLFEAETVALATLKKTELKLLIQRKKKVLISLKKLQQNDSFQRATTYGTGKGSTSNTRIKMVKKMFRDILNDQQN